MCGIVAAVGNIDTDKCQRMLHRIKHRGPDDTGEIRRGNVWLGHQRLSIMDVEGGHQPLTDSGATTYLVANGEIYNHRHIREDLGHELFETGSDSEAALHALIIDGPVGLARLRGMFALAFATEEGDFLAARDPLGVKPLYWARRDDVILFASELRAFDEADRPLVESFPPGHCWSPSGGLVRFADAIPAHVRPARRAEEAGVWDRTLVKAVRESIVTAVENRMMSDVGVGVFLSGGLDSAIVAAVAAEYAAKNGQSLPTFAVGAEGSSDLEAARVVAEFLDAQHHNIEHHEILMSPQDAVDALPRAVTAIEHYDPSLVRSAVPNLLLAEYASKRVHAVLTGEGADELFAGYPYYHEEPFTDPDALQAELVRTVGELHHLNLQRCDRASMAFGLEAREPFLDRDVVELALSIPPEHKMIGPGIEEKKLLREAFEGWLPDSILHRGKEQFGDGSGAKEVLEAAVRNSPDVAAAEGVELRTREEAGFYAIWDRELRGIRPEATLGLFATT
ncbi:asparagine synthase (glutamine-hydrolyzing) [Prauserella cavernicola]|uniref:asparagine synthase (glutamine-hydrolyzing) n=1 Tax=Prauserella cavernicola TaxID=2800127 RepID=A0A934R1S5_9PSEU|nr:asparagine synthase (glutamine-hydrolyzing) [Prauserella cavernicola]MBK1789299.1 asparagine synthase (glutamine-hydrolyzing) [Prauserella cavernicola]